MASLINGLIQNIQIDNDAVQSIASTAYGVCDTLASTAAKVVDMTGFVLTRGITVHIKFTHDNTAENPTLNINSTGDIAIHQYSGEPAGIVSETTGWEAGAVVSLTYDGTNWIKNSGYNTNTAYNLLEVNEAWTGTSTTSRVISAARLKSILNNLAGNGLSLTYNGTDGIILNHSNNITSATASGSATGNFSFGGTFDIPTITFDNYGHITATGTTTLTVPNIVPTIHGGTGNDTYDANRLVYTHSVDSVMQLSSTSSIYASSDSITINDTSAPDNGGKFQVKGTSTFQHIYAEQDDTYDLGTSLARWQSIYAATSIKVGSVSDYNSNAAGGFIAPGVMSINITPTSSTNGYYLIGNGTEYGHLFINTLGVANTQEQSGIIGEVNLILGNNIAYGISGGANNAYGRIRLFHTDSSSADFLANGWYSDGSIEQFYMLGATSSVANTDAWTTLVLGNSTNKTSTSPHSQGRIQLYASGTNYTEIQSQGNGDQVFYLPNYNDNMYAVHVGSNNAVGNGSQILYVAANGRVTLSSEDIGSSNKFVYIDNGVITEGDTDIGDQFSPVYYDGTNGFSTVSPVQYSTWSITNDNTSTTVTDSNNLFTDNTYVISLVVTSGFEYLCGPLSWNISSTTHILTITSGAKATGTVNGYVITARGGDTTPVS